MEKSITFDVPEWGRFSLVVDPMVGDVQMTKVLMDGGSSFNIFYVDAFDRLRISRSALGPFDAPFHGVILGRHAMPLGRIALSVTFDDQSNIRTEKLTFEVVGFTWSYNAILGRPC